MRQACLRTPSVRHRLVALAYLIGACFLITASADVVMAQQTDRRRADQASPAPSTTVSERGYPTGARMPWRRVETRSASDGRVIVYEKIEVPNLDGGWESAQETITDTTRTTTGVQTSRRVFGPGSQGSAGRLLETTESQQWTGPTASAAVHNTWVADLDGGLELSSRQIENARSIGSNAHESVTTLLRAGVNHALEETDRTESYERQPNPETIQSDHTYLIRDANGRWQVSEARGTYVRGAGSPRQREEETIHRRDVSGNLTVSERSVTVRADINGRQDEVIETYSDNSGGVVQPGSLGLSRRVRRSTTLTPDGGRYEVEEVEARSPISPGDPMRVVQRTVTSVRNVGANRWTTERQVFELDVNGRLVQVASDTEESD